MSMQLQLTASPRKFLQVLLWMRLCALVGQSVTIAVVCRWLGASLPVAAMSAGIAALAPIAALTALRLRTALPATQAEVGLQLLIDIAELTALLYLSGGTTNPFASLYLLPVALASVALAWQWSVLITLSCLGCYGWLITHAVPLAVPHNPVAAFSMHVAGMHVTFAISAVLLAAVLAVMAAEIRRRDQVMAALREEALRREHLGAMGVLAAGAAHELSTPLFSMAMLVSELRTARRIDQGFRDDLELLGRQIQLCKDRLTTLLQAAGRARGPQTRTVALRDALRAVLDDWTIVRPAIRLEVDWQGLSGQPLVSVDEGFPQALTSLLDNAADASAARGSDLVRLAVTAGTSDVRLFIDDEGPGLDPQLQQRAGKAVFSTKPGGFGLGLVLSHVNLNRLRGDVTLTNRAGGGTRTMIVMPVCAAGADSGCG
jgi:two-component system sensor histidine kinase RegB